MSTPTLDQLRATYERESPSHPGWPRTWEQAQASALTMALLRTLTAHPGQRGAFPYRVASRYYSTPTGAVDLKRRASGERDD